MGVRAERAILNYLYLARLDSALPDDSSPSPEELRIVDSAKAWRKFMMGSQNAPRPAPYFPPSIRIVDSPVLGAGTPPSPPPCPLAAGSSSSLPSSSAAASLPIPRGPNEEDLE
eukprot:7788725-Heterocapsa_arctica.AAC.1